MALRQSHFPSYDARAKRIDAAADPAMVRKVADGYEPSFKEQVASKYLYDNHDWADLIRSEAKQNDFMKEITQQGKEELTIHKELLQISRAEKKGYVQDLAELKGLVNEWSVKQEDELSAYPLRIKQALKANPHLMASILEDGSIQETHLKAIEGFNSHIGKVRQSIHESNERIFRRLSSDIQEMHLAKKFEEHLADFEKFRAEANAARTEAETATTVLGEELANQKEASAKKDADLAEVREQLRLERTRNDEFQSKIKEVDFQLKQPKGKVNKSNEAELERALREQKAASDEATSQLTQTHAAEIKSLQSKCDKYKKDLDEAKRQSDVDKSNARQHSKSLEQSLNATSEENVRLRDFLRVHLGSVTGFPIDPDLLEDMVALHLRSEGLRQEVMDSESRVGLPHLSFVPDTTETNPLIQAIIFLTNARADRLSFESTQALFNASRIGSDMAPIYPWVLAALQARLEWMPRWGDDLLLTFQRILATLQGIMFLGILAHKSRIAIDEVRELQITVETYLTGQSTFGSEPFVRGILSMLAASLDGQAPTTWIAKGTTSGANGIPRLDATNSTVGAHRCLFTIDSERIFVLLDDIGGNETLYVFTGNDVEALSTTDEVSWHHQLDLVDCHVASCIARHITLGEPSVTMWAVLKHISADQVR
ncbi:MAG: hypothetical protein LQ346_003332 [Caloplaca aetnensis]|nr:MAG: hypothetical protein LQ346_003332 [Caloplaca aetnensis]